VVTVSDTELKGKWWHSWITPQTLILAIGVALTVGGWMRDKAYIELRLERLEQRVAAERVTSDLIYMRRDVLTEQLRLIQEEQMRQRELIQLVRKDLR
jgi:hypothetical protein